VNGVVDGQEQDDEERPTVAESPVARAAEASVPNTQSGRTSSIHSATAMRAMRAEELTRARGFGLVVSVVALVALASQQFVTTAAWLQRLMSGSLVVTGAVAFFAFLTVKRTKHPTALQRVFGAVSVATAIIAQYYAGVFSPAPAVIGLGIAYWGLSDDRKFALGLVTVTLVSYFIMAAGVSLKALPDLGLFPARDATLPQETVAVATILVVLGLGWWQARVSRNATIEAIQRLDEALRLVQQREALLDEANQNLDVALDAAGGRRGPYTGAIAGSYRLGEVVGRGAMGEVYAAAHVRTGATAAVKLLHGKALANPDIVQRFLRESEIATQLRSPNLVTVYEIGQIADTAPFIAMELLVGHDLGWFLRRRRALPLAEVVDLVVQVSRGLEVAHAAGVVHRDLKPPNVFRTDAEERSAERWKILDFGVAKLRGHNATMTHRAIIGTPGYMSPEQAQGHDIDHRSDLFSLGSCIYRALTGRPPFSGPDTPQVLFDIVFRQPVRPTELQPTLPKDIDLVLAIAMAKFRDDRFGSANELAAAFFSASVGELHPVLRARAATLLRTLPWGQAAKGPAGVKTPP
jgi:serine/threonine-protein kinase